MKRGLPGVLALGFFLLAGTGLSAGSFSDPRGDNNAAPDITSLAAARAGDEIAFRITVANYASLPSNSWFNVWLDTRPGGDTTGDDVLVRFTSSGDLEHWVWSGEFFREGSTAGVAGSFISGVLTLTVPSSIAGPAESIGVLVVSSRSQVVGTSALVASDFAPDRDRYRWTVADPASFQDPERDHAAAPDIASVRVSDAKDGWIRFAISTPSHPVLTPQAAVLVLIDVDGRSGTGDRGADLAVTYLGGEVELQRWSSAGRRWDDDLAPTRARTRNAAGVVTVELHRSELGDVSTFGFNVGSIDFNFLGESPFAVDLAPDDGSFWSYKLTNGPALRLVAGASVGKPATPRTGKPFVVSVPVTRSDTGRAIASGTASCLVRADGKSVRATGRVRTGRGECSFVVPAGARALRGSLTVRSGGKVVTVRFGFRVG